MCPVDPRLDLNAPVVERDLGAEREIADPLPEGTVPDLDALDVCIHDPACIARVHDDDRCRPDDACWVQLDDGVPHHVSHAGRCWHEVGPDGVSIQILVVEPAPAGDSPPVDAEPAHDDASDGVQTPAPSEAPVVVVEPLEFVQLRDELYARLVDEGNPRQLSITLATLYAEWKLANVPQTMSMLADLASSIGSVLGGGDGGGGFLAKMIGKAMKGQAG